MVQRRIRQARRTDPKTRPAPETGARTDRLGTRLRATAFPELEVSGLSKRDDYVRNTHTPGPAAMRLSRSTLHAQSGSRRVGEYRNSSVRSGHRTPVAAPGGRTRGVCAHSPVAPRRR